MMRRSQRAEDPMLDLLLLARRRDREALDEDRLIIAGMHLMTDES